MDSKVLDLNGVPATNGSTSVFKISVLLGVLVVLRALYHVVYTLYFHPLSSYPGPKLWALTQLPLISRIVRGNLMDDELELHRRYGRVVRIGPNDLSYAEQTAWRDVWAYRKGHDEFSKSDQQMIKPPNGVAGILGSNRMDHRRYRKILSASFSERAMREQQPKIMRHVDLLVSGLRSKVGRESQDLVQWFNWTTFDVIGELAFGESFRCLEDMKMHPWIDAVFGNLKALTYISAVRRLGLDWIVPYLVSKEAIALRNKNTAYAAEKIERRMQLGSDQGDFWDSVLRKDGSEDGLTFKEMVSNAGNLVLGGSETTATLLSGCLYLLLQHPAVMEKIVAELRTSFQSDDQIDLFTVNQLSYTLAVLDETMRIYPPVPSQAVRVVPAGGDTVGGNFLPGGVTIHLPQYPANHLEANFTRPEEFIPERFLGAEEFRNDNFEVFQPFSVGPRNCIGKNLAYAEMRLVLAKILWNFEFVLDEATGDWLKQRSYILWEKKPLLVKVKERTTG